MKNVISITQLKHVECRMPYTLYIRISGQEHVKLNGADVEEKEDCSSEFEAEVDNTQYETDSTLPDNIADEDGSDNTSDVFIDFEAVADLVKEEIKEEDMLVDVKVEEECEPPDNFVVNLESVSR